ncbi:MAG: nuclear transport factor 2 family protein [Syntrophales bacterium]|nr:nuclear transport factor 2 family protein [Syntrophales bacterium]
MKTAHWVLIGVAIISLVFGLFFGKSNLAKAEQNRIVKATMSNSGAQQPTASDAKTRAVLDHAIDAFYSAWTTGDWEPFFATFADDIVFQFPIGPSRGRYTGSEAKKKMMAWRRTHEAHDRIPHIEEDLRLYDSDWVVVCTHSVGNIGGKEYNGLESVFMRASGGKIVEYREYLGNIGG